MDWVFMLLLVTSPILILCRIGSVEEEVRSKWMSVGDGGCHSLYVSCITLYANIQHSTV